MNAAKLLKLNKRIILASKSPRRKQLLSSFGFDFDVIPSDFDEDTIYNEDPAKYVIDLAKSKALSVGENNPNSIIIGADTTVYFNGEYLNKPSDKKEAKEMLGYLSNSIHSVYSGICVFDSENMLIKTAYEKTDVKFRKLEESEIDAYVAGGSPLDKAGAYGIQDDFGALFVEKINGDFYNVVGLPILKLYSLLKEL